MKITPLKTMLKTKIVKEFLKNKKHEEVVTNPCHGYKNLLDFLKDKYSDYKENGEVWEFDSIDSETFIYNVECDLEVIYEDISNIKIDSQ